MNINRYNAESTLNVLIAKQSNPGMKVYLQNHRERLVRTIQLIPIGGDSVLDVGATEFMLSTLKNLLGYKLVAGILYREAGSPIKSNIEYEGIAYPINYLDAERDVYLFDNDSFDVLTCFEVIEHFTRDPMFFLSQARRLLKQDGLLIISTPNVGSIESLLNLCQGIPPMLFYKYVKESSDRHHIEYTPSLLRGLVEAAGFTVCSLETVDDKPEIMRKNLRQFSEAITFIDSLGYSTDLRERRIFCIASNTRKCFIRYPDSLYHI